mgnify:CR=1 FL=1
MARASVTWNAGMGPGYLIMQSALAHNNTHHGAKTGVHVSHSVKPSPTNPMGAEHTVHFDHKDPKKADEAKNNFRREVETRFQRITGR